MTLTRPIQPPVVPWPLTASCWTLDPSASSVEFGVRQFWGLSSVHGRFDRCDGELEVDASGAGHAELRIEAASVDTGNRRRDRHLRAGDYFDCDRHPFVRYVAAVTTTRGSLELAGTLRAVGRTIPLALSPTADGGDDRLTLSAAADVDARALGMSWSPVGKLRTPVTLAVRASLRRVA